MAPEGFGESLENLTRPEQAGFFSGRDEGLLRTFWNLPNLSLFFARALLALARETPFSRCRVPLRIGVRLRVDGRAR